MWKHPLSIVGIFLSEFLTHTIEKFAIKLNKNIPSDYIKIIKVKPKVGRTIK